MESCAPFNADRDLRIDIAIEGAGLRGASASDFRQESILILTSPKRIPEPRPTCVPEVVTKMDQLLQLLRREIATTTPAFGHAVVSFDERSHIAGLIAVVGFECVGREGGERIDQLATSVLGGRDGAAMSKKHLQKTASAESSSDISACDLTLSSPAQARITRPSSD